MLSYFTFKGGFQDKMNLDFFLAQSLLKLEVGGSKVMKNHDLFFLEQKPGWLCDDYVQLFYALVISYPNDQAWNRTITRGLSILEWYSFVTIFS